MNQGKFIRLGKICGADGKAMLVAADHGLMLGPIGGVINLEETLKKIIAGGRNGQSGTNGILVSVGQAMRVHHLFHGKNAPAMLLRGDMTSGFRSHTYTLPNQKIHQFKCVPPKKALAMGADAMVVYYLLGRPEDPSNDEATNIRTLAKMAEESEKVGLPFIIEPMPFGPRVTGSNYVDLLKIGIKIAEEIGADAIKIPYSGDTESFRKIVQSVDIPIFILGGAKSKSYREACELVEEAISVGAAGTVFGRQILQAPDPGQLANYLMQIVHENASVKSLFAQKINGPSRLKINLNNCTGCGICAVSCSLAHSGTNHPNYYAINVKYEFPKRLKGQVCTHCGKCMEVCPNGAITEDPFDKHIVIDQSKCDLCRSVISTNNGMGTSLKCVNICPKQVIKSPIPNLNNTPYSQLIPLACDLCGGIPECVEWCPNNAIEIKEMK